jgi:hypothetical protein
MKLPFFGMAVFLMGFEYNEVFSFLEEFFFKIVFFLAGNAVLD